MPKNVFSGDSLNQNGEVADANDVNKYGLYGGGSDGSYTSGDDLDPGKVYNFTDFVLEAGDTLQSTASNNGEPIIVKVQGDVDISGTIDLSGQGFAGGSGGSSNTNDLSSGNGFNTYALATGYTDDNNYSNVSEHPVSGSGTPLYNTSFASGGAPSPYAAGFHDRGPGDAGYPPERFMNTTYNILSVFAGTGGGQGGADEGDNSQAGGGGGASYDADGSTGSKDFVNISNSGIADGGDGGGAMIIICEGDLSFTGTINISGSDGSVDGNGNTGGGGGAGGMFYGVYNGALTDSGTKTVAGGSGGSPGNTSANGGDGANGSVIFDQV